MELNKDMLEMIESIEFEQRLDGNMRQVRLVMPIVPGVEAMHLTGVAAQEAQLRFILLTAAGICQNVGKQTVKTELYKVLTLILSQLSSGAAKGEPTEEEPKEEPPKDEQH